MRKTVLLTTDDLYFIHSYLIRKIIQERGATDAPEKILDRIVGINDVVNVLEHLMTADKEEPDNAESNGAADGDSVGFDSGERQEEIGE